MNKWSIVRQVFLERVFGKDEFQCIFDFEFRCNLLII